jgi:lysozyme
MAACAVLVGGFEGLSTTAYHDKLANGLPTVCYGETEGVKMGDHYTKEQCLDMLAEKLPRYWYEIEPFIHVPLSDNEKIAYTSFDYNLGSPTFYRSSFLKLLNAGNHKAACEGMLVYNRTRSMGVVKGLDIRRHKEVSVCETIEKHGPVVVVIPLATKPHTELKPLPVPKRWWQFWK